MKILKRLGQIVGHLTPFFGVNAPLDAFLPVNRSYASLRRLERIEIRRGRK
jgi:hypothetical protein